MKKIFTIPNIICATISFTSGCIFVLLITTYLNREPGFPSTRDQVDSILAGEDGGRMLLDHLLGSEAIDHDIETYALEKLISEPIHAESNAFAFEAFHSSEARIRGQYLDLWEKELQIDIVPSLVVIAMSLALERDSTLYERKLDLVLPYSGYDRSEFSVHVRAHGIEVTRKWLADAIERRWSAKLKPLEIQGRS